LGIIFDILLGYRWETDLTLFKGIVGNQF